MVLKSIKLVVLAAKVSALRVMLATKQRPHAQRTFIFRPSLSMFSKVPADNFLEGIALTPSQIVWLHSNRRETELQCLMETFLKLFRANRIILPHRITPIFTIMSVILDKVIYPLAVHFQDINLILNLNGWKVECVEILIALGKYVSACSDVRRVCLLMAQHQTLTVVRVVRVRVPKVERQVVVDWCVI
jgi:hypothetical protein